MPIIETNPDQGEEVIIVSDKIEEIVSKKTGEDPWAKAATREDLQPKQGYSRWSSPLSWWS